MRIFSSLRLWAIFALALAPVAAYAGPINYTLTGSGASGTFNGVSFSGQTFTIFGLADTANATTIAGGFPAVLLTSATIQIGANPLATVTIGSYYVGNVDSVISNVVGFFDSSTNGGTNAFTLASGAQGWDVITNLGPVSSPYFSNSDVATDQGVVSIDGYTSATFTASTGSSVPEPGTLSLLVLGTVSLIALRRRPQN